MIKQGIPVIAGVFMTWACMIPAQAGEKTVKVFILAGQSNMVGHGKVEMGGNPNFEEAKYDKKDRSTWLEIPGGIGSLRHLATDPKTKEKFGHHLDDAGNWIVRDDVYITANLNDKVEKGQLKPGFGKGPWFGPELDLEGFTTRGNWQDLCRAQLNVGVPGQYPEFQGNVSSVDTRSFRKSRDVSPSHMGHHWFHNAEPHFLVGEAMVKLLKQRSSGHLEATGKMPWQDPHYAADMPATQADSRARERAKGGWTLFIRHSDDRKKWVTEKEVDYLLIGDSITFQWSRSARQIWEKYYGHRKAVNIGSSGDKTQHMLWHIQSGGLDGMKHRNPKVVQLLIGTNNRGNPELEGRDTAAGILALLKEIHHRLPESRILLMALFPRGWTPDDKGRIRNNQINEIIKDYADGETVIWVDLQNLFLDEDGNLSKKLMKDGLHPTPEGYVAWAEAMEPMIRDLLGEESRARPSEE